MIAKGIALDERPEGAVFVKLDELLGNEKEKYRVLVVLRSDGTALYATEDLALAIQKFVDYPRLSRSFYVVDVRQSLHFQQVFKTLELAGYPWAGRCEHIPYELVNLPGNVVMASREGTVVLLEDLIREAFSRALEVVEQKNPDLIPEKIKQQVKPLGLWDVNPRNLFRISWKNDVKTGLWGDVNYVELPSSLTGVKARIIGLVGKYFPTGAHKVGAAFSCLVPRLVSGEFDPTKQKAVWPSTGNYCRGGAYDCALLGSPAIAILPQDMSPERFAWLKEIGTSEIFATPGCESNVKEIYDKCWELIKERGNNIVIFNQFAEIGNPIWHYNLTGNAALEVFEKVKGPRSRMAARVSATGSAGTIAAGDRLKQVWPDHKIVGLEPIQCPTLYNNGSGSHRIEGIGDKHVTWIHDVWNMDAIMCIDDMSTVRGLALLTDPVGKQTLAQRYGVPVEAVEKLSGIMGISSVCNVLGAIKTAQYYEMGEDDVVVTIFTDAIDRYHSVMDWLRAEEGVMDEAMAAHRMASIFHGQKLDYISEGTQETRERWHNLKYYTWVEQQGKTVEELDAQRDPAWWEAHQRMVADIDEKIIAFRKEHHIHGE